VPEGGVCRDNFHALLLLEWQIPGGPGELAHFYAVATYLLQHPGSMNLLQGVFDGLAQAAADALAGRATIENLRARARHGAAAAGRVTRREGDPELRHKVVSWPITIADVLTVEAEQNAYFEMVSRWARSVLEALHRNDG
jgi:hypothetical protein